LELGNAGSEEAGVDGGGGGVSWEKEKPSHAENKMEKNILF
jgi:hypothetical protein